jgi:anti-sigma factor RsiW
MNTCRKLAPMLDAHVDGELSPEQVLTVETHALECESCGARLRLEQSMRKSLRRAVYAESAPTAAFQERLAQSLAAERERLTTTADQTSRRGSMLSWGTIVPLATAAALALVFTASKEKDQRRGTAPVTAAAAATEMNVDQLLDDLVDRHIEPAPPAVIEPTELVRFEPEVGVPVKFPSLQQYGARWVGGRVVPVRNQRAASLRFHLAGHRMTLYVFNSERFPLKNKLEARVVKNEPVYVGWKRGYSIATTDRHGVGYAIASDLDHEENAEMVASLTEPRAENSSRNPANTVPAPSLH